MPTNLKIGIIPFKPAGNYKMPGSTFLRAVGLVNNSENYEIWKHARKYDGLIFQKNYWTEMMKLFNGPKILDVSDPDWVKNASDFFKFANMADAITCSSPALTEFVTNVLSRKPVFHVPDRLDFNLFPNYIKRHTHPAKKVIWFGYIHNAHVALKPWLTVIKSLNLTLEIISDKDYNNQSELVGIEYLWTKYEQSLIYQQLCDADIILNPKASKAFFKYKSNNKTIIGWNLGIPVAETLEDLTRFLDPLERRKEILVKKILVEQEYNIKQSVVEYDQIFNKLLSNS
ncbi:MAG: hypothetical protein ABIN91_19230 [Mucilaginibacter sp.]|uniref:hypothetical protein n=1 Tax=Mucilaginibacter sp. TaxID=1882438 RepID=UPI00326427D1